MNTVWNLYYPLLKNIYTTFLKCWDNVEDVGSKLYKCNTIVLWVEVTDPSALARHWSFWLITDCAGFSLIYSIWSHTSVIYNLTNNTLSRTMPIIYTVVKSRNAVTSNCKVGRYCFLAIRGSMAVVFFRSNRPTSGDIFYQENGCCNQNWSRDAVILDRGYFLQYFLTKATSVTA